MSGRTVSVDMAYLSVQATPDDAWAGRRIPIVEPFSIGRGAASDIQLEDPALSRRHALVTPREDGRLQVEDQGSSNGLLFGGQAVGQAVLEIGEQFSIGRSTFRFERHTTEIPADDPRATAPAGTRRISNIDQLIATISDPFEEQGRSIVLVANEPMLLVDPDVSWWVREGHVDLFAISLEDGLPVGRRDYLASVPPGGVFFCPDPQDYGSEEGRVFVAVGKGAVVRELGINQLQLLARRHRDRISRGLEGWIRALGAALRDERGPSERALLTDSAEPQQVSGILGSQRVLWLEVGSPFFFRETSYQPVVPLFPIGPEDWIDLESKERSVAVRAFSTAQALSRQEPWLALELYHRAFCECFLLRLKVGRLDDAVRLRQRARESERAGEMALGAIRSVMGGTKKYRPSASDDAPIEPLLEACRLIGERQGFEVRPHPYHQRDKFFDDALADIAIASGFRVRQIRLEEGWWRSEIGDFLAPREGGRSVVVMQQEPAPLWTRRAPRYTCIDPVSSESRSVDRDVARELTGFAHVLYRPFPRTQRTIDARVLLRFAMASLGPEIRAVLAMGIGLGLLSMAVPFLTGKIYDLALLQTERTLLLHLSLGLLIAALATASFQITQKIAVLRFQGKADYATQAAVWDRILDLPVRFFRRYTAGDLADRAAGISKIRGLMSRIGVAAILGSVASLFNAVQMGLYSLRLATVAVILTLLYVALTVTANILRVRLQRQELKLQGGIQGLVVQLIGGMAKLRVSGAETHAFRVWADRFSTQRRISFRSGHIGNFVAVLNSGYMTFATLILFLIMAHMKQGAQERGESFDLSTGDFLAFMAAFGIFTSAVQALGTASVELLQILPIFERLKPVLEAGTEVTDGKVSPGSLRGEIEISRLYFRYDPSGPPILENVSLHIPAGRSAAIVGGSGSGKSTLLRLLLGFEQPERGVITFDGQDLQTLDLRLLRQQMGVVLQDSRILPADIFRNIVGASSRTEEEAWAAAAKAGLDRDIRRMPMHMHTVISEGGGGLSGGQKQRLMIARALVNKPRILFFDEATSALDNETQLTVQRSLEALDATRVVIAHRLSTIRNVDKIFYLHEGKIAEEGSYEELIALDGHFARMAARQQLE
ncbi:MAG: NHLP bacteriocin export ABC transporter permease/ATPase subunit [Holophagales bacterium]|nr:NHLP bacteriocin export ABC transporter permease/ATPase subunit [Holophagales bacterium]